MFSSIKWHASLSLMALPKPYFGNSALWKATFNENVKLVKLLLENGASPLEKDHNGETYYALANKDGVRFSD